ncbi:zinc finger protein 184-like [Periplaneta americana]|uniref:zinc finger protein 184-like n=1 Tax=Periplaneta americana TaxID=6978 RepID=UPI0037E85820
MEIGMTPVSCPVCTLYMREGVTLQSHLNTHPKDQVIAALVRISAGGSNKENQNENETVPISTSEIAATNQEEPSSPTNSHFTTAITYQQFLSSNGSTSSAIVPQYVSMPTILSTPTAAHTSTNQATFMHMLYNPYMVQQQQQQQQQFQLLSSVNSPSHSQPFIRHVLPSTPNLYPPHVAQSQMSLAPASVPLSVPYQVGTFPPTDFAPTTVPQVFQNTTSSIVTSAPIAPVSSSTSSHSASGSTIPAREQSISQNEQTSAGKPSSPVAEQPAVSCCKQQQVVTEPVEAEIPVQEAVSSGVIYSDARSSSNSGVATKTSSTQCEEDDDQKSPCITKDEENECSDQGPAPVEEGMMVRPPRCESVRVRRDLNDVAVSPMVRSYDEGADGEDLSQIMRGALCIQPPPVSVVHNDEYITSDQRFSGEGNSGENEVAALKAVPKSSEEKCEEDGEKREGEEGTSRYLDLDQTDSVNIIEIDGIHILVPSQFLENRPTVMEAKLPGQEPITLTVPAEDIREPEPEVTTLSSLNIQTDETMPPRGELSEQESVGGNDSSMWPQGFQDKDVSTSYDLLARESWEASDGSDVDIIMESRPSPSANQQERSGMSSQDRRKASQSRVYKCGTCGVSFNCPKERRVHQSTYHTVKSTGSEAATSTSGDKTNPEEVTRRPQPQKRRSRIKKVIKEEADENCVKAEPQFMGVFLKEDTETKMEAEDADEISGNVPPPTNGQTSEPKIETDVPKEEELPPATFPCNLCDEVFTTYNKRGLHERKVHNKKTKTRKNTCGTCNEIFPTEVEFNEHLQTHPLECSQCGKYFYRRQNLELHLKRHLGIKPHKCTICDKAFVTKQKLTEHTNSHTGNAPIKCPMCDETFRRYSNLIQHKHRHHMNIKKKIKDFICHCGEIFHSKKKLEWHKEIHEEKPKCCTYCSERFVHAASLTRHIRKAHDCRYVPKCGREVENVECTVCGYVFLKSSLQVHMRMHSGERPYPCHVCGKDFTTKWNLQLHRWTHAARSSKPFKCSLCKSAFFRRNDYTAHMHSHRNVRPYTCNHCGCQFIRKYNCLRHVREHEVGKSFSCNVCGKMFHRSYYLKEHMRVHSGARPFACHICGKASSTKSNHNKHVKIHHAREPVNTEG